MKDCHDNIGRERFRLYSRQVQRHFENIYIKKKLDLKSFIKPVHKQEGKIFLMLSEWFKAKDVGTVSWGKHATCICKVKQRYRSAAQSLQPTGTCLNIFIPQILGSRAV